MIPMELREIVLLFRKDAKVFFGIIAAFLLVGVLLFLFQGGGYNVSMTLNVTRDSSIDVSDYAYDAFYRLQADERFADTVVRWLQSPSVVSEIFSNAQIDTSSWSLHKLKRALDPERLSSQVIAVNFSSATPQEAIAVSHATSQMINDLSQELNKQQNESAWFIVLSEEPIVKPHQQSFISLIVIMGILGLFVAFWSVIIRHYMSTQNPK